MKSPSSVLLILIILSMMSTSPFTAEPTERMSSLPDHDPILVGGNSDFLNLAEQEGWSGNGSANNPIIVEGYRFYRASHMLRLSNIDLHILFRNNEFDGIAKVWCAIVLDKVRNIVIANNTIHHAAAGVHVAWSNDTVISGNEMYQITYDGVFLDYYCYNNTIVHNEMYDMGEAGVFAIGFCRDNLIADNQIHNNPYGICLTVGSDSNTILSNRLSTSSSHGLYLLTSNNLVKNNLIYSNTGAGILVGSMTHHNYIAENFLYNNSRRGVELSTSSNNTIEQNDFIDNKSPQACDNGSENVFRHNYWSDWTEPDEDENEIVDAPYAIAGTASSIDRFAITESYRNVSAVLNTKVAVHSVPMEYLIAGLGLVIIIPVALVFIARRRGNF
ncbi:MAG: nitrous oxide reductase family maturation protein NosD [Candidatus Thorarchaeota archaeon]